jgi:1,2-dihydroxy-3-keto-5-methylthiopentene dioxygenase
MAILQLEKGKTLTDIESIGHHLATLNIQLKKWPVGEDVSTQALLAQPTLQEEEKEQVLFVLDHYFESLEVFHARDMIVLNPATPNLDGMLEKFSRPHTHSDDEVRYIVDGEGRFGFVCPDGTQMELTIQPEEYINVPAGTEHWFCLTPQRRIKAIRYFVDTLGWTPEYTHTEIRMQAVTV